jgi:DNA polymerase III delta prime subunit
VQRQVAQTLTEKVAKNDLVREVLFIGDSGIGKTTIGRIYIQALLGEDVSIENNIHTINCSAETGIDFIRTGVIERLHYLPLGQNYSIFELNEIHGLSPQAQNALLAEIEPLPSHVIMVATTTNPEKLIPTLRSRFTEYKLPIPTSKDFQKKAGWINARLNREGLFEGTFPKEQVDEIIGISHGNVRTFDRYMQQLAEGSYKSQTEVEEPQSKLFDLIFRGQLNLNELLTEAKKEKDYVALSINLCNYAIAVLSNNCNPSQPIVARSKKVLSIFGDGLNKNVPDKVSFSKKLLELTEK